MTPINVSSNNFGGVLVMSNDVAGVPVVTDFNTLSHFNTSGNIFSTQEITTADLLITADGKALTFSKNEPVVVDLSIAPFIKLSSTLSTVLKFQQSTASNNPVIPLFTLTTWFGNNFYQFIDGILHKGTIAPTVGQEHVEHCTYTLKFVTAMPIPPIF